MARLIKLAGLNEALTPLSLRHTHTSLLAEAGVGLEAIIARLCHCDDDTTRKIYLHVTRKMKRRPPRSSVTSWETSPKNRNVSNYVSISDLMSWNPCASKASGSCYIMPPLSAQAKDKKIALLMRKNTGIAKF